MSLRVEFQGGEQWIEEVPYEPDGEREARRRLSGDSGADDKCRFAVADVFTPRSEIDGCACLLHQWSGSSAFIVVGRKRVSIVEERFVGEGNVETSTDPSQKWIGLLATVALIEDLPERRLSRSEVGTVVEVLERDVYEVEFNDDHGETYAELALGGNQLVPLHNRGDKFRVAP